MAFIFDKIDSWKLMSQGFKYPEEGREIFALIEDDMGENAQEDSDLPYYPFVERLVFEGKGRWRLLDFDPEDQEEYLRVNNYSIVAWRYV